jgi:hypothetical protein
MGGEKSSTSPSTATTPSVDSPPRPDIRHSEYCFSEVKQIRYHVCVAKNKERETNFPYNVELRNSSWLDCLTLH